MQEGWLRLDAHIMATPAIGDINGDGHDALVVAVSWFFDREYYEDPVSMRSPRGRIRYLQTSTVNLCGQ